MLKKGQTVVMHTCMEAEFHDGQIWVCETDEFKRKGHNYNEVFLEGYSGSFLTEFLQRVNLEFNPKKSIRSIEKSTH